LDLIEYKDMQEAKAKEKKRFGEKETQLKSLHLSEISGVSDTLMEAGEMGDGAPIGPHDFPGIETKFEKETYEQRR
jgi:hypothetical protein